MVDCLTDDDDFCLILMTLTRPKEIGMTIGDRVCLKDAPRFDYVVVQVKSNRIIVEDPWGDRYDFHPRSLRVTH